MAKTFITAKWLLAGFMCLTILLRPEFLTGHSAQLNAVGVQTSSFLDERNQELEWSTAERAVALNSLEIVRRHNDFNLGRRGFANLLHFVAIPQPRSEYTLPIEPSEAGREAERILGAIAAWVTSIVRDNPSAPQLSVVAPVKAFEIENKVIVEFRNASMVFNDGGSVVFGDVEVAITPLDGGFFDFSVNLPTQLEFKDAADTVVSMVTFAEPKLSGTWWQIHDVPTAFVARFSDIKLFELEENGLAGSPISSARQLTVEHSLARDDEGLWQGRAVANILDSRENEATSVSVGEAAFTFAFSGFAFDEWRDVVESFEHDNGQSSSGFTREQTEALLEAISSGDSGDVSVEFVISDFQFSDEVEPDVNFSRFSFGFGAEASEGVANLRLDLALEDLSVEEPDVSVSVGEVALTAAFTGFAFEQWRQLVERFELDAGQGSSGFTEEQSEALAQAISDVNWDASVEFVLSDFQFSDEVEPDVNFSRFSFGFGTQTAERATNLRLDLALEDLSVEEPDVSVSVGEVALTAAFTGFAFEQWRQLVERFELDAGQGSSGFTEEQSEALAQAISDVNWDASVEFVLSDFQFSDEVQPDVNLSGFSFGFGTQASEGAANLRLDLALDDLSVADPDVPKQLLPDNADLQLRLEGVPLALAVIPRIALVEGIDIDPLLGATFGVLGNIAPENVMTRLVLELAYRASLFGVSADGAVELNLNSSNLGLGAFMVIVEDLGQLLEFAVQAESRGEPWAIGVPTCLARLQEIGEISADTSSERHVYQIDIPGSGLPTVNGKPIDEIDVACDVAGDQPQIQTQPTAPAPHTGSYCYRPHSNDMAELRGPECASDAIQLFSDDYEEWSVSKEKFKRAFASAVRQAPHTGAFCYRLERNEMFELRGPECAPDAIQLSSDDYQEWRASKEKFKAEIEARAEAIRAKQ